MDEAAIVAELKLRRRAIDRAIAALGSVRKTDAPKRKMSAEARRKISLGMRKRWAAKRKT